MCTLAPNLLFITGVLAGLIAGFILSRMFALSRSSGSGEARLLEERLLKADHGLEEFSRQPKAQSSELQAAQQQAQHASEQAAVSRYLFQELRQAYSDLADDDMKAMVLMALDEGVELSAD